MRGRSKALIAAGVVVVLVGGAVTLYLDRVATLAVEQGGTYALGVETRLGSARLGLLPGRFGLYGLEVSNAPGFEAPNFLTLERAELHVGLPALLRDPIVVSRIELEGIGVTLERTSAGLNYRPILEHLEQLESGDAPQADSPESSSAIVRELVIRDVSAQLRLAARGRKLREIEVKVPEIRLRNLGSESEGGLEVEQLVGVVTKAVLAAVVRESARLPVNLSDLRGRLARLEAVPIELPGPVAGAEEKLGDAVEEKLGEAADKADSVIEGVGDLLRRPKDDAER